MDEKIVDALKGEESIVTDSVQESSVADAQPKIKKRIFLKVISTVFYSLITILAFVINTLLLVDTIAAINTVAEGWDGLGKGIGLALVVVFTAIVGGAGVILYQIPSCLSLVGLCTSFKKTKRGEIRGGKIYFSVILALTVVSEILLALMSVGIVLLIKFTNG